MKTDLLYTGVLYPLYTVIWYIQVPFVISNLLYIQVTFKTGLIVDLCFTDTNI